jgi:hypothetical protein
MNIKIGDIVPVPKYLSHTGCLKIVSDANGNVTLKDNWLYIGIPWDAAAQKSAGQRVFLYQKDIKDLQHATK